MAQKATSIPVLAFLNKTDELALLSNQIKRNLKQLQNAADELAEIAAATADTTQCSSETSVNNCISQRMRELEHRIQLMVAKLMDEDRNRDERNSIESELRAANRILEYYRSVLMLEEQQQTA